MIHFTKMHGLGNDFMVIDAVNQAISLTAERIRQWARRDTGIGFDQCLVVEASHTPKVDFNYRIFNASGEEVGQCGNGARCLARFIHQSGLSQKNPLTVATTTTSMSLTCQDDGNVAVKLAPPVWEPKHIPCLASIYQDRYVIELDSQSIECHIVSVGNPHAVILVDELASAPVDAMGKLISEHPFFPEQVNVGFLQIQQPGQLNLRVYERGCGETKACGSGAAAAAIIARRYYEQPKIMSVALPGGHLTIQHNQPSDAIVMTGSATFVYEGVLL